MLWRSLWWNIINGYFGPKQQLTYFNAKRDSSKLTAFMTTLLYQAGIIMIACMCVFVCVYVGGVGEEGESLVTDLLTKFKGS